MDRRCLAGAADLGTQGGTEGHRPVSAASAAGELHEAVHQTMIERLLLIGVAVVHIARD